MDSRALITTLRRVEQNDDTLFKLKIGGTPIGASVAEFDSSDSDDYSRLGVAIGNNTHLETLIVDVYANSLTVEDREFYDGLKRNSSIQQVHLVGNILHNNNNNNNFIIGGVLHEVLKVYKENSSHLTKIGICFCNLVNGGDNAVAATLRNSTNLKHIDLSYCGITDEQLLPVVEAVRGHRSLEVLDLANNIIGNVVCEALATLLEDPDCSIHTMDLSTNQIGVDGAVVIVNSLSNNNHLRNLDLENNPADEDFHTEITKAFDKLLCNTSSINNTNASNHTLETIGLGYPTERLEYLLDLNEDTNKSRVATEKILKHHPKIDMEPLFGWDAEEGEQNLKALRM